MRLLISLCVLFIILLSPIQVQARVTVADQINEQQASYQTAVSRYSVANQQKLKNLSEQISQVNKNYTDQLERTLTIQGQILDEYQSREDDPKRIQNQLLYHTPRDQLSNGAVEKARYWLTFAQEAVAYQAAHQYIFNLRGESAIKADGRSLVNQLKSDLKILTQKALNAQIMVKKVINEK